MTATELVSQLEALGVQIWEEGGELRFRAPKGVMNDERRAAVKANREQVIAHLRQQAEAATIRPAPDARHEPFPLTDVQSAYLLGRQDIFAYGGVGCQVYAELRLDNLDPQRLEAAWNRLIARHDMLRATVHADGYQQVMQDAPHYAVAVDDLRHAPDLTAQVAARRERMAHGAFAPDQWPLFELAVTQGPDHALIHFCVDFLIADYMSVQLLLSELAALYRGDAPAAPTDLSFRDYVLAERGQREGGQYQRDRDYWMSRLEDLPEAPALPVRPQAGEGPARFRRLEHVLDRAGWAAFRANAGRHNLTPSVAVLAAYAAVVARWSRNDRFLLNLTLLNRQPLHADVGGLIGDFTTVGMLAVDHAARSFAENAKAVQAQLWADMDHRLFSGVEVMRELSRLRGQDAAMTPVVFTSTIGLNESAIELGRPVFGLSQTPQVWLDCQAIEREDTLLLQWDIREGVLPESVAEDMFAAMADLLGRLAADGDLWLEASPVALPAAQQASRAAANATDALAPQGLLHQGFFAQAAATPDAIAVIDPQGAVDYATLAHAAGGIAQALRDHAVQPGERVAIALPAGRDQIAAVLGTHLAGAAYLPLDLGQPPLRRDRILADAGARLVLAAAGEWPAGVTVLDPATIPPAPPQDAGGDADGLAYVIYTSGSTGDPKGVMISHAAALNTVHDINQRMQVGPRDRVFGLANLNFDLSVYDIFGPLAVGAALVLPDPALRHDPAHWCDLVARHGVTLWNSVPAQMQMLLHVLDADPSLHLPSLRRAMLSGDWIALTLPPQLRARLPELQLFSLGGATEAAIWSNIHAVGDLDPDWPSVPYGKPLTNQRFHILDRDMADAPDWVAGELCISGAGLALGYMNDAARTGERFVTHPATGERLYRTGDMGRYRPGGVIEFLGREDSQVKIRGYRIELAEIEAAMLDCAGIAGAAVLIEGDTPMDRRLSAFVQPGKVDRQGRLQVDLPPTDAGAGAAALAFTDALNDAARHGFHAMLQQQGGLPAIGAWGDAPAIMAALRVAPSYLRLMNRWLHLLTQAGLLVLENGIYSSPKSPDPAVWDRLETARVAAGYPDTIPRHLANALDHAGAMMRGEIAPTDVFFPGGDTEFAVAAYADTLIGRRVNDAVIRAVRDAVRDGPEPLRVLELGAGVGGTSAALIPAIADLDVDYQFTDISRFFLNRAQDVFAAWPFVRYGIVDITRDLRQQGQRPNSLDVIVACNVLHYADDLPALLRDLGGLLRPGGRLVIVETIEEIAWTMASLEFLVNDDHDSDDGFFQSEADWVRILTDAAGEPPEVLPRADDPLHAVGQRVFVLRCKADRAEITETALRDQMADRLPAYMIPARIEVVDALPLTPNGKIDRKTMRGWLAHTPQDTATAAPEAMDPLEERLATLWSEVLGTPRVGRHDNFFQIGGDSLLVSQLASRLHERFDETTSLQFTQTMRQILRHPTIAELAVFLRKAAQNSEPAPENAAPASPITPLGEVADGSVCFLVHEMGGTMAPYLDLINQMKTDVPLFGLAVTKVAVYLERDPGDLIQTIADEYAELLADRPPARLAGYGMGGLLAVAVASRLAERGVAAPAVTVIGGCGATCDIQDDLALEYAFCRFIGVDPVAAGYPADTAALNAALADAAQGGVVPAGTVAALTGQPGMGALDALLSLDAEGRLQRIADAMAGNRQGIDALGYARAHLSLFRHSLAAYAAFRPGLYAGDLELLLPENPDPSLPWLDGDVTGFWQGLALGQVHVQRVPGSHFDCLKPPHVADVAARLLAQVRA